MNDQDILMGLQACIFRVQQRLERIERFLGSHFPLKGPPAPTGRALSPGASLLETARILRARKCG